MTTRSHWNLFGVVAMLAALMVAFAAPHALAATYTWDAEEDNFWVEEENWDPDGVPTVDDTAIMDHDQSFDYVYVDLAPGASPAPTIGTLQFQNVSDVEDEQFDVANGTLQLDVTAGNAAILQTTADAATAASRITGNLVTPDGDGVVLDVDAGTLVLSGQVGTQANAFNVVAPAAGDNVASGATLEISNSASDATANNITGTISVSGTLKGRGNSLGSASLALNDGSQLVLRGDYIDYFEGLDREYYPTISGADWPGWGTIESTTPDPTYSGVDVNGIADGTSSVPGDAVTFSGDINNYSMAWFGALYLPGTGTMDLKFQTISDDASRFDIFDGGAWQNIVTEDG